MRSIEMTCCPCYKCVCNAICRIKPIFILYRDCELIAKYCRPYGSSEVYEFALSNVSKELGRNFIAVREEEVDESKTIIRDADAYAQVIAARDKKWKEALEREYPMSM